MTEPFLYRVVEYVVQAMGDAYPEIRKEQRHCELVIKTEEESFNRTLDKGIELFESIAAKLQQAKQSVVPGAEAFKLYDTYGFPLDLTELMAEEKGLTVDREGFEREMENQRARARESGKFVMSDDLAKWETVQDGPHSAFKGYETTECQAKLCMIGEDQEYWHLVFDQTPFYGESGGQVGDTGVIVVDGREFTVVDTLRFNDRIVHLVKKEGEFPKRAPQYTLKVDRNRRMATACNHTGTHLLQAALRRVLGDHVHQSGSLVTPERLRFDFTHYEKVTEEQLREVEQIVNQVIGEAYPVTAREMAYQEAVDEGATALFEEKYGDRVRVISVERFSSELCGGTHVGNTAQIRLFRIVSESSVATGVRRIEAVTGDEALKMYQQERTILSELAALFKADVQSIPDRVKQLTEENLRLRKEKEQAQQANAAERIQALYGEIKSVGSWKYISARVDGLPMELLREAVDKLRDHMKSGVVVLGSVNDGKVNLVAGVTKDLTGRVQAGALIKKVASEVGGSGGGRPDMAQAGGKDPAKLDQALKIGEATIAELLKTE